MRKNFQGLGGRLKAYDSVWNAMAYSFEKPNWRKVLLSIYTAKSAQVVTSLDLLTSCNNLLQQVDIRMRSHGLRQLVTTSLLQVVNRLVASFQNTCCKLIRKYLLQVI